MLSRRQSAMRGLVLSSSKSEDKLSPLTEVEIVIVKDR